MNLVTDGLPALALGLDPPDSQLMQRPPVPPDERIFDRGLGAYIVRIGSVFSVLTLALVAEVLPTETDMSHADTWKTMVFTTLCLAQMGHAVSCRSELPLTLGLAQGLVTLPGEPPQMSTNPYLLASVSATTVLQVLLVYVPALRHLMGIEAALSGDEMATCVGYSAALFVYLEVEKYTRLAIARAGGRE